MSRSSIFSEKPDTDAERLRKSYIIEATLPRPKERCLESMKTQNACGDNKAAQQQGCWLGMDGGLSLASDKRAGRSGVCAHCRPCVR